MQVNRNKRGGGTGGAGEKPWTVGSVQADRARSEAWENMWTGRLGKRQRVKSRPNNNVVEM